jgi:hypothetical protein
MNYIGYIIYKERNIFKNMWNIEGRMGLGYFQVETTTF